MKSLQFFKGLSWLIGLNFLIKPVWIFFIDRQVQNIVGLETYGKYFAILNLSYVLFFLSDAGLTNMLNQRVARGLPVHIGQLLRLKVLFLFIFAIVCFSIGWLIRFPNWNLLVYIVIIQVFTSLFLFLRGIVTANQYFTADALLSVLDKFLMVVLCGGIIYTPFFGTLSINLFLEVQILCTILSVIATSLFLLKKERLEFKDKENLRDIIKRVAPFALIILLMSAHYRFDGFLLERLHPNGALEAGIYASAYRLLDAGNMVGYLVASFLVPFAAKHLSEKKILQEATLNARHLLLFFSIGVTSFSVMFAPWIQQVLYHSNNSYHSLVIQLCIAAFPAYCLVHVYGSLLTAGGMFKEFISILVLSVAFNLVLNVLFIPAYGAEACCLSALISQYFCGFSTCIIATRRLQISFDTKSLLIYIFSAFLFILFFFFARTTVLNVWIILALTVLIGIFLLITQLSFFKKYFISLF